MTSRYDKRIDAAEAKLAAALDEHVPTVEGRQAVSIAAHNLAATYGHPAAYEAADDLRADMAEILR